MLAKARKVDSYENMSRQQLGSLRMSSAAAPAACLPQYLKDPHLSLQNLLQDLLQDLKNSCLFLPQDQKHLHHYTNTKGYWPKKIAGAFDGNHVEYKSESGGAGLSIEKYTLKTLDHISVVS